MKKKTTDLAKYTFVLKKLEANASEARSDQRLSLGLADDSPHDHREGHDVGHNADHPSFRLMEDRGFEAKVKGADPQTDLAVTSIGGEEIDSWQDTWVKEDQNEGWM